MRERVSHRVALMHHLASSRGVCDQFSKPSEVVRLGALEELFERRELLCRYSVLLLSVVAVVRVLMPRLELELRGRGVRCGRLRRSSWTVTMTMTMTVTVAVPTPSVLVAVSVVVCVRYSGCFRERIHVHMHMRHLS